MVRILLQVLGVTFLALCILVLTAVMYKQGRLGQSSFFQSLDQDESDELTYVEWMDYYLLDIHDHPIERCMRVDFYLADCDQDDVLTWREYHDFRFLRKSCESPAVPSLNKLFRLDPKFGASPANRATALSASSAREATNSVLETYRRLLLEREKALKERHNVGD